MNDACVLLGKPNAYGSIFRFEGQASVFATKGGPCYRCLYPEPPPPGLVPSCAEGGVLGVLPGVIGTIQATEAIKLLLGAPGTLIGRLLLYDAWGMRFRELKLRRDPECPVCGDHPTVRELIDYDQFCGVAPAAAAAAPGRCRPDFEITVLDLKRAIDSGKNPYILDVREPQEYQINRIPGSVLIPLGQVGSRVAEIKAGAEGRPIVVQCKMGGRSAKATQLLRAAGPRARPEPEGRDPGLDRSGRSEAAEVLSGWSPAAGAGDSRDSAEPARSQWSSRAFASPESRARAPTCQERTHANRLSGCTRRLQRDGRAARVAGRRDRARASTSRTSSPRWPQGRRRMACCRSRTRSAAASTATTTCCSSTICRSSPRPSCRSCTT